VGHGRQAVGLFVLEQKLPLDFQMVCLADKGADLIEFGHSLGHFGPGLEFVAHVSELIEVLQRLLLRHNLVLVPVEEDQAFQAHAQKSVPIVIMAELVVLTGAGTVVLVLSKTLEALLQQRLVGLDSALTVHLQLQEQRDPVVENARFGLVG
jgi:hypothetical protein